GRCPINSKDALIKPAWSRVIEFVNSLLSIFLVNKGNKATFRTKVTLFKSKLGTGDLTKRLEKFKEISSFPNFTWDIGYDESFIIGL
ncbi:hypothetical protein A2U01_0013274, partial [Trifolium medium]|nr:hypothetical protein [Trifolium medium]